MLNSTGCYIELLVLVVRKLILSINNPDLAADGITWVYVSRKIINYFLKLVSLWELMTNNRLDILIYLDFVYSLQCTIILLS